MRMIYTGYPLAFLGVAVVLFMSWTPLHASEADDRIESSALRSYMFRTYLKGDQIQIQSREGVVTLMGTVTEVSHMAMAEDTVAELPGVARVSNQLGLSADHVAPNSDGWLSARVKAALLFHRNVSARHTEVTAIDGMVTLRGEATSRAQRDLATEYVGDVEGVESVRNFMTISKTSTTPTPGQTAGEMIDDASITAQVKTALLFRRSASAGKIRVKTTDGTVTLGGTVRSAADKALVVQLVTDIDGVRSVVNDMTIEQALSMND